MMKISALPVAATAAVLLTALSAPAGADTPLAFDSTYSYCDQTAGGSQGRFECSIGWSGGTGTVTATFTAANQYTYNIQIVSSGNGYADLTGSCATGHGAAVTATLTDSTNATLTRNFATSCAKLVP